MERGVKVPGIWNRMCHCFPHAQLSIKVIQPQMRITKIMVSLSPQPPLEAMVSARLIPHYAAERSGVPFFNQQQQRGGSSLGNMPVTV
jgi:hypothetical protein